MWLCLKKYNILFIYYKVFFYFILIFFNFIYFLTI